MADIKLISGKGLHGEMIECQQKVLELQAQLENLSDEVDRLRVLTYVSIAAACGFLTMALVVPMFL